MKKVKEEKLYFGIPIKFNDEVTLYQPTLKDIIYSDLSFEALVEPFMSLDKRNFESEEENSELENFDMFFIQIFTSYLSVLKNGESITLQEWLDSELSKGLVLNRLVKVIKFLFKTDDVQVSMCENIIDKLDDNYILINKSYKINRSNYEDFKWIICDIFDTDMKVEKKRPQTEEEDELAKRFAKKKANYEKEYGREAREGKNKDHLTIYTLVNYIVNNKNSQYTYESIQNLTIYQIKNTFKYYQNQESYDIDIRYRTSGNFKVDKQSEHWFFDK